MDTLLLKDSFSRAFVGAGLKAPDGVFEALAARYSEPGRAYHTLQHIAEGLGHLKNVRYVSPEVPIAWWFHDAIYDPKRTDNEEKSAAWAAAVLGKTPLAAKVNAAILATKAGAFAADPAARLMVDIDIAILAAPEPRYSEAAAQIRQEYAYLNEADYKAFRLKVLRSFSGRAFIYQSPEFRSLETRARKNLEREINAQIVRKK
ncbi:HD domain-containing protein [Rhizomicrobium electricum]|uniref:Metal-dependent hydrolase n=1 Tax=Rhizomicrobium electricum TaxID=480070 RepID=A0ABN1EYM9_9PROT|nr:N-methyl-D-aspartate receptor NMDAR2C subunit [Rhizomicrobium electricum]NIJ49806.1 putative metal-dependent HD superfamily phosphohydrolase [Rhizomicrobium electricum]